MDRNRRTWSQSHEALSRSRILIAWALAFVGLPLLTWLLDGVSEQLGLHNVLLLYLLAAVVVGVIGGILPALATAVAGFLLANWFFTEPLHTLIVADPDHLVSIFVFLVVALAVGLLVGLSTRRSAEARRARAQAEALATSVSAGRSTLESNEQGLVARIRDVFSLTAVSLLRLEGGAWQSMAWSGDRELLSPAEGTEAIELTPVTVLVLLDGRLTADDRMVLRAFAAQIVFAMEREELEREAQAAEAIVATDRLRTALLDAVSHDLRTPLATIKASLTSLLETGVEWSPTETRLFLQEAVDQAERLNRMVGRLLDAGRLQAGAINVFFRSVGLDEVVSSALSGLAHVSERVSVDIPESLDPVQTDPDLLERAVANLVENAMTWSRPGKTVNVAVAEEAGRVKLRIIDRGPGIPLADRDLVFQPFQRLGQQVGKGVGLGLAVSRGLLEAMGNSLSIEDTAGGGTTMLIELKTSPAETPAELSHQARRG